MKPETQELYEQFILCNYAPPPIAIVRGKGARVWDDKGCEYLDFSSGVAVNALGHCHPVWVKAVKNQIEQLGHCSNLFASTLQGKLARRLCDYAGPGKVFFCNSGAEATETLLKFARLHGNKLSGKEGLQFQVLCAKNSFHGRTFGGMSATGQEKIQTGFRPVLSGFSHAEFNNLESFESALTDNTSAILVETIQGEGGIHAAKREFMSGLRDLCTQRNILLLLDEVQCGAGRTGTFFAFEEAGIIPDGIAMAKGLGGGFPIGAAWIRKEFAELFQPGSHGCTFGGNPMACAAAQAVLDVIEDEKLLQNVQELGSWFLQELVILADNYPGLVDAVRGRGFLIGVALKVDAGQAVAKLRGAGLLSVPAAGNVVRFLPPLNVTRAELLKCLGTLEEVLRDWSA